MKQNPRLHWLSLFVVIVLAVGREAVAVTDDLQAKYEFQEGSGSATYDVSGNGNTGTIAGAAWSGAGFLGNCLDFSGGSYVSVADSNSLDLTTRMTLEAWVYADSLPTSGDWHVINKRDNTDTYVLSVGPNYVRGGFASDETPQQYYYAVSNIPLPTGRWTHLAVTYDGVQVKIYVNGVQSGVCEAPGKSIRVTGETLYIAKNFEGGVDQVLIYSRDKSKEEIARQVVCGSYRFNQGGGTSTVDSSGCANDGNIVNATWATNQSQAFEGTCLTFDSVSDEVVVPDSESLDLAGPFTLSAWVNPRVLPTSGDWHVINKRDNVDTYVLSVGPNYVRGGFASDDVPGEYYYAVGNTTLPTGRWTHLAVTYDGAQVKIYVNGVLGGSVAAANKSVMVTAEPLHLAKGFDGQVDDVKIIRRALSGYEVQSERLRCFWGFEEGIGLLVGDYSENANTAIRKNGAAWNVSGVRGKCINLDGVNDYVTVNVPAANANGSFKPYDAITVEAWINPNGALSSSWKYVVGNGTSPTYWLAVRDGQIKGGFLGIDSIIYEIVSSVTIPSGKWSHIAMTFDGFDARMYLNGVQTNLIPAFGKKIASTNNNLCIGSRNGTQDFFKGRIDEVCVLSAAKDYNIAGMLASAGAVASLEHGSYPVYDWIKLLSNQTVEGRGTDRTVLRLNDGMNRPALINFHPEDYDPNPDHDIVIRDLSIEGNSANNTGSTFWSSAMGSVDPIGVWLSNTYNFRIERASIRDTRGYAGICAWPNHPAYENSQLTIKNYILHCSLNNTQRQTNQTHGGYGSGMFISGFGQRNVVVGRNTCGFNQGVGIFLEDYQSYIDVVSNSCTNNTNGGIWLNSTGASKVLRNTVENNGGRGILLDGGGSISNQLGTVSNVVSYNTVRYNGYEGIYFTDNGLGAYDSNCIFSYNTVEDNNNAHAGDVDGISVVNMRKVAIDSNVSRDTRSPKWQYYGITTEGSSDYNTIINNDLRYNLVGGLSAVGGNNVINGNQQ